MATITDGSKARIGILMLLLVPIAKQSEVKKSKTETNNQVNQ